MRINVAIATSETPDRACTPMDEDLIEPGGSGGLPVASQSLLNDTHDETDQERCTPYASASSLATPNNNKQEVETPPPSPADLWEEGVGSAEKERAAVQAFAAPPISPLERAAIAMSRRRAMTKMKASVPYVVLSCVQTVVGAAVVAVGGAAFATTPTFNAGCFWAGLAVSSKNIPGRS